MSDLTPRDIERTQQLIDGIIALNLCESLDALVYGPTLPTRCAGCGRHAVQTHPGVWQCQGPMDLYGEYLP
jgi:hypothetical protein